MNSNTKPSDTTFFVIKDGSFSSKLPSTSLALKDPDGLLALGGDLKPQTLLSGYKEGIFPWYSEADPITWWAPHHRSIIEPSQVHISRSMYRLIRKNTIKISCNKAFSEVIYQCGNTAGRKDNTWITQDMIDAYSKLHQLGFAHSIECWQNNKVIGGLYGVSIGNIFFAESMFSNIANASKLAFIFLCLRLAAMQFAIIDCQIHSSHLATMGAKQIARSRFENLLKTTNWEINKMKTWEMDPCLSRSLLAKYAEI